MSRVGQKTVAIPSGVTVDIQDKFIKASGKVGSLTLPLTSHVKISKEGDALAVEPATKSKESRSMWGTTRNQLSNLVNGVAKGFTVNLELVGVGYRAAVQGKEIILQLGYSHEIKYPIPQGITVTSEKPTTLSIFGADKQQVGQVAAEIRAYRKPEPYKGKGVKYENERIVRKEGKKK